MLTVEAQIDEQGNVKILQRISVSTPRRALVVILDEPATIVESSNDEENPSEAEFAAEDQLWQETFKRHAAKFAKLRAQAEAEVASGNTIEAFDEKGDFAL